MTHEETPEERFTKIDNFLSTVAEHLAHMAERQDQLANHQVQRGNRQDQMVEHQGRMAEHHAQMAEHQVHMAEHQADFADRQATHDKDIRELREIQTRVDLAILKMAEAQHASEEKLNALIGTVDRIIGRQDDNPS